MNSVYIGGPGDKHTWPVGTRDPANDDDGPEWENMTHAERMAQLVKLTRQELAEMYLEALYGPLA